MTLPASGVITFSNFNTEAGRAATTAIDMAWIKANTKSGQESNSLSGYYSKAWYTYNVGACNNGNCTSNCNCGGNCTNCNPTGGSQCGGNCNCNCTANRNCSAVNCYNCLACNVINCANCDARSWFQSNCNCYAQCYNCNITAGTTANCTANVQCNCNCSVINCACDCACY